jgi:chromosome segregation ATPase
MRRFALLVLFPLAACMGGRMARPAQQAAAPKLETKVSDVDFARLAESQRASVDRARDLATEARDDMARAELRSTEAKHEDELARADVIAAQADIQRAKTELKMAQEAGDQRKIGDAQAMMDTANMRLKTAQARVEFANRFIAARKADQDRAKVRADLASAKVEQAKMHALQANNIPAASKYDAGAIDSRVSNLERQLQTMDQRVRTAELEAQNAQQAWVDMNRRYEARAGSVSPRG